MKARIAVLAVTMGLLSPSLASAHPGIHTLSEAAGTDALAVAILAAFAVQAGWWAFTALPRAARLARRHAA
jgi:hypothetical protein